MSQFEATWKKKGLPVALRRLESGDFDKNEMRVVLHLLRLGCRPWCSVQVSATRIGKSLGMQTVKVGAVLRKLERSGVIEEVGERWSIAPSAPRAGSASTGHARKSWPQEWKVSSPDTWDRPATHAVSAKDTGSHGFLDDEDLAMLAAMAQELREAQPGQRHHVTDEVGKVEDVLGEPSTYPDWMGKRKSQRTRQRADQLIKVIEELLGGRFVKVGERAVARKRLHDWLLAQARRQPF